MAELAANRGVDVINMSIGGLPALNDGDNARATLYNTIVAKGVQIVLSAGNSGNALNTVGDPAVATDAMSVGASISKQTWLANYGSEVPFAHGMLTFSSGGPREDGGFKPNVTAPGSAISTTPTWQPGGPVAEAGYGLPAGYSMFNGTSMAAPQAAGVVSLLLSAAKAEGVKKVDDQRPALGDLLDGEARPDHPGVPAGPRRGRRRRRLPAAQARPGARRLHRQRPRLQRGLERARPHAPAPASTTAATPRPASPRPTR